MITQVNKIDNLSRLGVRHMFFSKFFTVEHESKPKIKIGRQTALNGEKR